MTLIRRMGVRKMEMLTMIPSSTNHNNVESHLSSEYALLQAMIHVWLQSIVSVKLDV